MFQNQNGMDAGAGFDRFVHIVFQRNFFSAAHAFIGGDNDFRAAIKDAVFERFR